MGHLLQGTKMHPLQVKHRAVIHYTRFERSLRKVAKHYDVGKSTLSRWVKQNLKDVPTRRNRRKLYEDIRGVVSREIGQQPFQTAETLCKIVRETMGTTVSMSTMYRTLHLLGNSYKRSSRCRNHEPIPEGHPFLSSDSYDGEPIAVDESSFYWNDVPRMGWGPKGKRVKKARPSHRKRVSLLLAVGKDGVVGYCVLSGGVKSQHFVDFVKTLPEGRPLILDNCSIHKTKSVKELCKSKDMELRYIPPYCPWYNPVEFCFSEIKRAYRPIRLCSPSDNYIEDIEYCVSKLRHQGSYFDHARRHCEQDRVTIQP